VNGERHFEVIDAECVGCNLCVSVCPVDNCITMHAVTDGIDARTGKPVVRDKRNWTEHPNNPMRKQG
jgi:dihydropyrimidine dehydrogenase (NAD+) subunit PreA